MKTAVATDHEQGWDFEKAAMPYVDSLYNTAYRMTRNSEDAEDLVQETFLRAWRGLAAFQGRSHIRSWLYKIATNACLKQIGRRPSRVLSRDFGPPADPTLPPTPPVSEIIRLEPYPDVLLEGIIDASPGPDARYETRETVELAFIAALQQLPPRQRAALVLRDVLGFHAAEVADMLDSSVDSVKSALKRARATLEQGLPRTDRAPLPNSAAERELMRRFADAFETDDINGIVALLTEDAWLTMPPTTLEYQGRLVIASFLRENTTWRRGERYRLLPTRANTQPAFATYRTDAHARIAHATGLVVLTLEGERIAAITQFLNPGILSRFGFSRTLRGEGELGP